MALRDKVQKMVSESLSEDGARNLSDVIAQQATLKVVEDFKKIEKEMLEAHNEKQNLLFDAWETQMKQTIDNTIDARIGLAIEKALKERGL